MNKLLIFFLLFFITSIYSQVQSDDSLHYWSLDISSYEFQSSYSIYFSPGVFIPISSNNKHSGIDYNLKLQKTTSKSESINLDIDIAFTKGTDKKIGGANTYLQLVVGPKFFFPQDKKFEFFASPKIGLYYINGDDSFNNQSVPICVSLEAGMQYNFNKSLSLMLKINNNSGLIAVSFPFADLINYTFVNCGIGYKF